MRAASPSTIGGRRRRSPRPNSCIDGSGPKAANTSRRSASLSLSRVSSSWLRTKCAHWQASGIGGSSRSAVRERAGLAAGEGQVHRLHDREGEQHLQLVAVARRRSRRRARSGGRFTSPSSTWSPLRRTRSARISRSRSCGSRPGSSEAAIPCVSIRNGTASMRNPDSPCCQPEAHDLRDRVAHRRVGDVQVGLVAVEVVQVVLPRLLVVGPDAVLGVGEDRLDVLGVRRRLVGPDVEVAVRRVAVGPRRAGTTGAGPRCGSPPGRRSPGCRGRGPSAPARPGRPASPGPVDAGSDRRCRSRRRGSATGRRASARCTSRRCRPGSRSGRSAPRRSPQPSPSESANVSGSRQ